MVDLIAVPFASSELALLTVVAAVTGRSPCWQFESLDFTATPSLFGIAVSASEGHVVVRRCCPSVSRLPIIGL